ncbi:acyl-coenzyme A thioesterase 9, mitochondrial isoform X1 [Procambarus clarkii]|uniref:acyl-coenzyme A thioesterase 9, mitochondrial isoform X1 n=1 Tax=Procambarus clarkii TaxID=6728 RepID=UPI001E675BBD|nr:acyl-coenzyme A thioesterase 9, mitochondrial-like isoform X1 [Procambarus clarkii]
MSSLLLQLALPCVLRGGSRAMRIASTEGHLRSLAAPMQKRQLHMTPQEVSPSKTIRDVITDLTHKVGASKSFSQVVDRTFLLELLPASRDELPVRTMMDSWDSVLIPLGSEERLREKYVTFMGGVRIGRLLEDLDVFAVWLCYKHIKNPRQKDDMPSPYSIVTALVDRIDFNQEAILRPDKDIRLSGHVSWTGRSSMETIITVEQDIDGIWKQVTRALFVMVARDPLNQGSVVVNKLVCESPEERKIYQAGEINKLHRKVIQEESLFRVPPNETEKTLVHELFMSMANPKEHSYSSKKTPENSIWLEDTKLKNLIICHPEHRNRFKKVFGGFIMRQAYELGWACAFTYSKQRPRALHIDDIMFRQPVEIGSLLYLNSQVVYTEGSHVQISTKASVMDPVTRSTSLTNIFHFTYAVDQQVPSTLPRTYPEAMLYLDGRRHYQLVRGLRKFYGQGEVVSDATI